MNFKNVFKSFSFILMLTAVFLVKAQETQPNIIWLVCEDQSPEFFPMYGDTTVSLPNLEALAAESVKYTNMHATSPVCAPARSGIITGMYPTTLGTHNMRAYNMDKKENQKELGIPVYSPKFPEYIRPFPEYLREAGYFCTNRDKEDYNYKIPQTAWDYSCHQRHCNEDDLYNKAHWRNRAEGQPFFSVFNFPITHESKIWEQGKNKLFVDPDSVKVPPYFPNDSITRHDMAVNYSNLVRLDEQLGKIIAQLKKDGLYENSYIFFYSDHGGPFPRHKRAIYQTGALAPLLVKHPKAVNAGNVVDDLVSFIDFAPTVLQLAGVTPPEYLQGHAFLGKKKIHQRNYLVTGSDRFDGQFDRVRAIRNQRYKFIRNYYPEKAHALKVSYREQMPMMQNLNRLFKAGKLNTDQARWLTAPRPKFEFYDLEKDPYELNNLFGKKGHQKIIAELKGALKQWIQDSGDLGEISEYTLIEKSLGKGK